MSPLRNHPPGSVAASVASGRFQYPRLMIVGPRSAISPFCPSGTGVPSASMIWISTVGAARPTELGWERYPAPALDVATDAVSVSPYAVESVSRTWGNATRIRSTSSGAAGAPPYPMRLTEERS